MNSPLLAVVTSGSNKSGSLPASVSFADVRSASTVLSAMKPKGNPLSRMMTAESVSLDEIVMRFSEMEGRSDKVNVKLFAPVESVRRANLLEEQIDGKPAVLLNGKSFEFEIGPNAVETFIVKTKTATKNAKGRAATTGSSTGSLKEDATSLYSSYWDLNAGAAYVGNSRVSVTIGFPPDKEMKDQNLPESMQKKKEKRIKKGTNRLRLTVSNNSTDEGLKGVLKVTAPDGLKATPESVRVDLAPLGWKVVELDVEAETQPAGGYVRADFTPEAGGRAVFAAMPVGQHPTLEATAVLERSKGGSCDVVKLRMKNNQGGRVDGVAIMVTPIETWANSAVGSFSLVQTEPRKSFSLKDGEAKELAFSVCGSDGRKAAGLPAHFWAVMKIAYNGDLAYLPLVMDMTSGK